MSDNWLTPIARAVDGERIEELFTALTTVGEGRRVAAGLTALAERHADNTCTDVVRVDPRNVILVVSSKGGCWSGREIELQIPLTAEESGSRRDRSRRAPTLWVSGSDGDLHRYVVPATLAYWVARKSAAKCGALRACEDGLVPSYDISGYLEPDWRDMPADSGLFLGLGLYALAQQIDEATRPWGRFAPAPQDEPLVLRREYPWSPADHEVPAGKTLRELGAKVRMSTLDVPIGVEAPSDDVEPAEGPAYIGPLPGAPHRRIRWDEGDDGVTIVLTAQGEDGEWVDIDATQVLDTAEDGAVEQAEDELLKQHQLCWADIDTETEEEDEAGANADAEPTEPTKYFNEAGEEISEWEAQLPGQAGEETGE